MKDDYPFQYHHLRSFGEHGFRLLLEKIFPCKVLEHRLIWRFYMPLKIVVVAQKP